MSDLLEAMTMVPEATSETGRNLWKLSCEAYTFYVGESVYGSRQHSNVMKEKFEVLKDRWLSDTMYSSSSIDIVTNPSYQKIIKLGSEILPFIVNDLRDNDNFWFQALHEITGENPVPNEHLGYINLMKQDWLTWAEENI